MTKPEALKCLAILKASYPRQELEPATVETYAMMLDDVDFGEAQAAIKRLICESKWFPAIAEIRAEVARGATASLPAVEVAWGEVTKAISRFGMNRKPIFSCPEIAAAVDVLGWRNVCLDENTMSTRARFTDAYRAYRERRVSSVQLGRHELPGAETSIAKQLMGSK